VRVALVLAAALLAACAARSPQEQRAHDECWLERARVGGHDVFDAAIRRSEVYTACMRAKGYGR
jgi:hypothetical protein